MNKRGFTLIEVISVIALLSLIIGLAVPGVMKSSKKAKERTLNTKIKNIEKAAVLFGQDNRNFISKKIKNDETEYKYCFKDGNFISNCYYYEKNGTTTITVNDLVDPNNDGNTKDGYIAADDESGNVLNSTDESKYLNICEIQIYKKYGKIYAVYDKTNKGDSKCWID